MSNCIQQSDQNTIVINDVTCQPNDVEESRPLSAAKKNDQGPKKTQKDKSTNDIKFTLSLLMPFIS
jgi:hypothetical protein